MNGAFQEEITSMSNFRYKLIEQIQQLGDNDPKEKELNEKVDRLAEEIIKSILSHFDFLQFDFIMEQIAKLGSCPNLLNDDNGNWAVSTDGYQNVVSGDDPQDVATHFFIEAKEWKKTPKEALKYFLEENEEE